MKQIEDNNRIVIIRYLFNLFIKSFLFALIILMIIMFSFLIIYLGDSLLNIKNKNKSNPIFSFYIIVSQSMVPTIKVNDGIVVKRVDDNIKIGDIISFNSTDIMHEGLTITHRVVGIQNTQKGKVVYRTKGDNNLALDNTVVEKKDIYGRVFLKIPKIGYVRNFFMNLSFIIFLIIFGILFVLYEVYRIFFHLDKYNVG